MNTTKPMRLFISHSSRDIVYVSYFVQLLRAIGITEQTMFCSSIKGYGIPLGENIYDYLKQQFQNYRLKVIFILSNNYYNSVASLNEMGAAWVLQQDYNCILLPKFGLNDIKGAIDPRNISIVMDSPEREVKSRLNELSISLKNDFGLNSIPQSLWEDYRDKFINNVKSMSSLWDKLNYYRKNNKPVDKWLFPLTQLELLDPEGFDVLYLLCISHLQLGNTTLAKTYLEKASHAALDSEMRNEVQKLRHNIGW